MSIREARKAACALVEEVAQTHHLRGEAFLLMTHEGRLYSGVWGVRDTGGALSVDVSVYRLSKEPAEYVRSLGLFATSDLRLLCDRETARRLSPSLDRPHFRYRGATREVDVYTTKPCSALRPGAGIESKAS